MQLEFMSDEVVGDAELYLYLDEAGLKRLSASKDNVSF